MEGACWMLGGKLFQRRGALLEKESVPGREEGRNGRRELPLPLVRSSSSLTRGASKARSKVFRRKFPLASGLFLVSPAASNNDVLVSSHNAVLPCAAGVAVQLGSVLCRASCDWSARAPRLLDTPSVLLEPE